jgi:hypothetical protein
LNNNDGICCTKYNYQEAGGKVKDDVSAVKHWETPEGGGAWAAAQ